MKERNKDRQLITNDGAKINKNKHFQEIRIMKFIKEVHISANSFTDCFFEIHSQHPRPEVVEFQLEADPLGGRRHSLEQGPRVSSSQVQIEKS